WQANAGGSNGQGPKAVTGAAFVSSLDAGATFSQARLVLNFTPFVASAFSGNDSRQCGDAPFNCPTGFTFPRDDLAYPTITTNGSSIDMAFQVALPSGQGQIQFTKSMDGGASWSSPTALDGQANGHQFFPWLTSSNGVLWAVYYDSRLDQSYSPM